MINIYNNKESFLREKPHFLEVIVFFLILLIGGIIVLLYEIKIYDNYQTKGYTLNDNIITTVIPSNLTFSKIYLNNKEIKYEIIEEKISIDEEKMVSYKTLSLKIKNNFQIARKNVLERKYKNGKITKSESFGMPRWMCFSKISS